jgi:hypothetical protein
MTKTVKEARQDLLDKLHGKIRLEKIKQFVDRYYGFDIDRNTRKDEYVKARTMYYYLSRTYTSQPLSEIGGLLNKDHATVLHSINNNHEFYVNHNQVYKRGLESFNDYAIRYVEMLELKQQQEEGIDSIAMKESVLHYENTKLREELRETTTELQMLHESTKVANVLGEIVNKIPENKLPIVVERLNAMVKML